MHVNPFGLGADTTTHHTYDAKGSKASGKSAVGASSATTSGGAVEVGAAVIFNPTGKALTFTLVLPLYYCGLDSAAMVSVDGKAALKMNLNRDYSVHLSMVMPPQSIATIVVARP